MGNHKKYRIKSLYDNILSYRGEYIVALFNDGDRPREVRHGDRIAQVVFQPYLTDEMEEVKELSATERGTGGFGSTGR